jgi:hypothetical protein
MNGSNLVNDTRMSIPKRASRKHSSSIVLDRMDALDFVSGTDQSRKVRQLNRVQEGDIGGSYASDRRDWWYEQPED